MARNEALQCLTMMRSFFATVFAAALLSSASVSAAERRPIAETDLYSFQWIATPRISPDGSRIVYTHVVVNPKHDGYETALWIIPASGGPARQLTSGPHDSSPQWSPDGRMLAFVRATEKDGKAQPTANLPALHGRRRGARSHRLAERRERPGLVAGQPQHRVFLDHDSRRSRKEEGWRQEGKREERR